MEDEVLVPVTVDEVAESLEEACDFELLDEVEVLAMVEEGIELGAFEAREREVVVDMVKELGGFVFM